MDSAITYTLKGINCNNNILINKYKCNVIINEQTGCWEWKLKPMNDGYGVLVIAKNVWVLAHRLAWVLEYGSIPDGLCVLHKCDNRVCVNPSHLFLGNNTDNVNDRVAKNRTSHISRNFIYNGNRKLSNSDVEYIRLSSEPLKELSIKFKVSISNLSMIRSGKRRTVQL